MSDSEPVLIQATEELTDGWERGYVASQPDYDLTTPEVRDRVLRVIGAQLGMDVYCCPFLDVRLGRVHAIASVGVRGMHGHAVRWYAGDIIAPTDQREEIRWLAALGDVHLDDKGTNAWALALQALWHHLERQQERT